MDCTLIMKKHTGAGCIIFKSRETLIVFLASVMLGLAGAFPKGAPSFSCRNLVPAHNNGTQSSPPPYKVEILNNVIPLGDKARVSVVSLGDFPFLGFICAASEADDTNNNPVGTMSHAPEFHERDQLKPITCSRSEPDTAMTHTNRSNKVKVEFDWSPPVDAVPGQTFKMRCTLVQSFFRCWTGIQVNISISPATSPPGSAADTLARNTGVNNRNNDVSGQEAVNLVGNNRGINPPMERPSVPETRSDTAVRTSPVTSVDSTNPSRGSDFRQNSPVPESGLPRVLRNQPNLNPSSFIPIQDLTNLNTLTNLQLQNQAGNPFIQPGNTEPLRQGNGNRQQQGLNEIFMPIDNMDLALMIELINMGFNPFQDTLSLLSDPNFNSALIDRAAVLMNHQGIGQTGISEFPRQSPDSQRPNDVIADLQRQRNPRTRSRRGPNSRGLFQSSSGRPFNRNFTRIRPSRFQDRNINSNNI